MLLVLPVRENNIEGWDENRIVFGKEPNIQWH